MAETKQVGRGGFFGHPWGLATLFFTEMWERFSWYGMRAILVLFLTATVADEGMGLSDGTASALVGVYGAMVYFVALPGGWIADRILGARKAVLLGGVVIMCGHVSMAIPVGDAFIWLGLTLIICGTGLLKPNVSTMVGQLYRDDPDESRRDSGFSIFYMGINLGAWLAPYVTSTLGQDVNWHLGFAAAAVGMALGLVQYVLGWRQLGDAGWRPGNPATPEQLKRFYAMVGLIIVVLCGLVGLGVATDTFNADNVANVLAAAAVLVTVAYFGYLFRPSHGLTQEERSHMTAYIWLFIAAAIFWMIYDQAATTLSLYAESSVDLTVLGWNMPSGWTQSFNPAMILVLSPIFAVLWLGPLHGMSTPTKFAIGVVLVGLSFVVMSPLAAHTSTGAKISVWWLAFVYFIQTVGELFLSPVGLAITTKLAPAKFASQMMGVWFLAVAVGDAIGGQAARLNKTVLSESMYYLLFGLLAAAAGVTLFMFVGKLRALMGEDANVDTVKN